MSKKANTMTNDSVCNTVSTRGLDADGDKVNYASQVNKALGIGDAAKEKMEKIYIDSITKSNRKTMLKRTCCYAQVLHLTAGNVDKAGNLIRPLQITVQALYESTLINTLLETTETKTAHIETFTNVFELQEKFLDKILLVDISKISEEDAIKAARIVVRRDICGKTAIYEYARKNKDGYYSLKDGMLMDKSTFEKKDGSYKRGTREYVYTGNSASGNKKGIQVAFDVTQDKDWIFELFNKVTHGGFSRINNVQKLSFEKVIKYMARIFMAISPSSAFFEVKSFGLIKGSYDTSEDFGGKPGDGAQWLTQHGLTKVISYMLNNAPTKKVGKKIYVLFEDKWIETKTLALHLQCRPITCKGFGTTVDDDFAKTIEMNYENKTYTATSTDDVIAQQLADHFLAKTECPKGYEHIQYLKVGENPEFIGDCDAFKMPFDIHQLGDFTVLDMPKYSDRIGTNSQLLLKALAHEGFYEETMELIKKLAIRDAHRKLQSFNANSLPEAKMSPIAKRAYVNNVIKDICPELIIKDSGLFFTEMKNMLEGLSTSFSAMSFEVSGGFYRLLPEQASFILGQKVQILDEHEAYTGNRNVAGLEALLEKLPSVQNDEIQTITFVGFDEIKRRIQSACKALNISKFREKTCINWFRGISDSAIVLARSTYIMIKLAGSDFDYDGSVVIIAEKSALTVDINGTDYVLDNLDEQLVNIFKRCLKEYAVQIKRNKKPVSKSEKPETYDLTNIFHIARVTTKGMKDSVVNVGTATNASQIMNIALMEAQAGNYKLSTKILRNPRVSICKELFSGPSTAKKYVGLVEETYQSLEKMYVEAKEGKWIPIAKQYTLITVTDNILKALIEEAKGCYYGKENAKLSKANAKKFLKDINIIFRFYQELIIDKSKTGEQITVQLMLTVGIKIASMQGYRFEMQYNTKAVKFFRNADAINERIAELNKRLEEHQQKELVYTDIIDKSFSEIGELVATMVSEYTENRTVTNVMEKLYLEQCSDKVSPAIMQAIKNLKNDNNNVYAAILASIKALKLDNDSEKAEKERANDTINRLNETCGSMFRYITNDLTPIERGIAAKYWDCVKYVYSDQNKEGSIVPCNPSRFSNIVPEETTYAVYQLAKESYGAVNMLGNKLNNFRQGVTYEEGETITFEKGIDSKFGYATEIPDGDYAFKTVDGNSYATKTVESLVENLPRVEADDVKSIICRVKSNSNNRQAIIDKLNTACSLSVVQSGDFFAIKDEDGNVICEANSPKGYRKNDEQLEKKWNALYKSFQYVRMTGIYVVKGSNFESVFIVLTKESDWLAPEQPQEDVIFKATKKASNKYEAQKNEEYYDAPEDSNNNDADDMEEPIHESQLFASDAFDDDDASDL